MSGKQKTSLFKKLLRLVFKDVWESTYKRKRQRALYRHHTFSPPLGEVLRTYYPRYRWIRRKKRGASGNAAASRSK